MSLVLLLYQRTLFGAPNGTLHSRGGYISLSLPGQEGKGPWRLLSISQTCSPLGRHRATLSLTYKSIPLPVQSAGAHHAQYWLSIWSVCLPLKHCWATLLPGVVASPLEPRGDWGNQAPGKTHLRIWIRPIQTLPSSGVRGHPQFGPVDL